MKHNHILVWARVWEGLCRPDEGRESFSMAGFQVRNEDDLIRHWPWEEEAGQKGDESNLFLVVRER